MLARKVIHALFAVTLLGIVTTSSIGAVPNPKRTTQFTFGSAVQLPGVTLAPGTYIFEIANDHDRGDLVRVMSRDRSQTYALQFTYFIHRPETRNMKGVVRLRETAAGTAPLVSSWFAEQETIGRAFIY